jgi:hypothetical protein
VAELLPSVNPRPKAFTALRVCAGVLRLTGSDEDNEAGVPIAK